MVRSLLTSLAVGLVLVGLSTLWLPARAQDDPSNAAVKVEGVPPASDAPDTIKKDEEKKADAPAKAEGKDDEAIDIDELLQDYEGRIDEELEDLSEELPALRDELLELVNLRFGLGPAHAELRANAPRWYGASGMGGGMPGMMGGGLRSLPPAQPEPSRRDAVGPDAPLRLAQFGGTTGGGGGFGGMGAGMGGMGVPAVAPNPEQYRKEVLYHELRHVRNKLRSEIDGVRTENDQLVAAIRQLRAFQPTGRPIPPGPMTPGEPGKADEQPEPREGPNGVIGQPAPKAAPKAGTIGVPSPGAEPKAKASDEPVPEADIKTDVKVEPAPEAAFIP